MKKVLTIVCAVVFICSVCIPSYAQLALWRSAATLKQGQYIVMTQFYYMDFAKTFDTAEEEWKDYNDSKTECGFQSMIGYGVTDRMEALIHIPFRSISYESANGSVKKRRHGGGGYLAENPHRHPPLVERQAWIDFPQHPFASHRRC